MLEKLKQDVCAANCELPRRSLVFYSWGNVSGIDRESGIVAIKPSGVAYEELTPDKIVLVDLDGKIVAGDLKPSSDTPTHLELYRCFSTLGGICHTHSLHATAWAQACREIPAQGTTHADYFYGPVPITEPLTAAEISGDYELNTGKVIVRRFAEIDPEQMPAVLVGQHGPFTWGSSPAKSVEIAAVLEYVAQMALIVKQIDSYRGEIPQVLLEKHYLRKHGENAYYGQS